jgi:hypothetical protein
LRITIGQSRALGDQHVLLKQLRQQMLALRAKAKLIGDCLSSDEFVKAAQSWKQFRRKSRALV